MDSSPTSSSILDTLRTVEFRLGLKGYNVDEVDEYLDRAAQESEALQEHVRQLTERLRQASDRIVQLERDRRNAPSDDGVTAAGSSEDPALTDETLQRTLVLAQKFVDQTKRESEAEAAAVVAQAEETARAAIAGSPLRSTICLSVVARSTCRMLPASSGRWSPAGESMASRRFKRASPYQSRSVVPRRFQMQALHKTSSYAPIMSQDARRAHRTLLFPVELPGSTQIVSPHPGIGRSATSRVWMPRSEARESITGTSHCSKPQTSARITG